MTNKHTRKKSKNHRMVAKVCQTQFLKQLGIPCSILSFSFLSLYVHTNQNYLWRQIHNRAEKSRTFMCVEADAHFHVRVVYWEWGKLEGKSCIISKFLASWYNLNFQRENRFWMVNRSNYFSDTQQIIGLSFIFRILMA